jgi:hypothetical protein
LWTCAPAELFSFLLLGSLSSAPPRWEWILNLRGILYYSREAPGAPGYRQTVYLLGERRALSFVMVPYAPDLPVELAAVRRSRAVPRVLCTARRRHCARSGRRGAQATRW